jgi:uncharacterized membrane protein
MLAQHGFLPEAGGSTLLRNVNKFLSDYAAQNPQYTLFILTIFIVFGKFLGAISSRTNNTEQYSKLLGVEAVSIVRYSRN